MCWKKILYKIQAHQEERYLMSKKPLYPHIPKSATRDSKQIIRDCFDKNKFNYFDTAKIGDVYRCTSLSFQEFIDTIWEMAQVDFIFDIQTGRSSPYFVGVPKRGVGSWNKTDIEIAEAIRAKVTERQLTTFGWPRFLFLRPQYSNQR
jgi:hypothetical protein